MSSRFNNALRKIQEFARALRRRNPKSPVIFLTPLFLHLLKVVEGGDTMMVKNFCTLLESDPDAPKDGRNVDHTLCHKTYMSKGRRTAMYRVLYYHKKSANQVYYIFHFPKAAQGNLNEEQIRRINGIVKRIEEGDLVITSLDEEAFE